MTHLTSLTKDQRSVLLKESKTMLFTMQNLFSKIQDESLTDDMKTTMLRLLELQYGKVCELLGFNSETRHLLDERFASSKAAYQRIEELEKKLADVSIDHQLPFVLKEKENRIRDWWNELSFQYVEKVNFHSYYTEVELGFIISTPFLSDTPETDRDIFEKRLKHYHELGMDIPKGPIGYEMMDTKINQAILTDLIATRFPSATIAKVVLVNSCANQDMQQIDKLIVHIEEFSEI